MIYTLWEIKEEFSKYSSCNTELAIVHVWLLKLILDKCNFREEQEVAQLLLDNLQLEYNALDMRASVHGNKLKKDLNKALKEVKGYIDIVFKYFQSLLDKKPGSGMKPSHA